MWAEFYTENNGNLIAMHRALKVHPPFLEKFIETNRALMLSNDSPLPKTVRHFL